MISLFSRLTVLKPSALRGTLRHSLSSITSPKNVERPAKKIEGARSSTAFATQLRKDYVKTLKKEAEKVNDNVNRKHVEEVASNRQKIL